MSDRKNDDEAPTLEKEETAPRLPILHYGPSIVTGNEFVDAALAKGGHGKPAACPEEVREIALANLEAAREAGKAPRPSE